ncbi:MAG: class I SAM-dependent methyltransferase, partial [Lentisphaeria bacterium]|nr:class I SAM-dependent methyltransferase [Lentisphaeria bacterium]
HVDAAKGMVNWCKQNAKLSGLGDAPIRFIVEDCLKYVQREERRGIKYDGIIMDPPSYGRGKSGETWKLEKHLWDLLIQCRKVLSDKPLFFLLNSYTTGLSPIVTNNLISEIMNNYNGSLECGELGIPIKADGKILPCGIFARWQGV